MPIEILMPALSPTMKEGNLAKWIKKEGDKIKAGEVIAEIETDKATMEVEAVDEGILGKILIPHGTENVAVNSCIALILADGEDKKALDGYQVSTNQNISSVGTQNDSSKSTPPIKNDKHNVVEKVAIVEKALDRTNITKASPLAKRIAKDEGIALAMINGSGPHGRVIKDGSSRSMSVRRNPQEFYVIKNNNIRKVIAKRLLESKQNVPHFYLSCEFKIDKLNELRSALNEVAEIDENGNPAYKISVNDLIIKATAMALKKVPEANSSWNEDGILVYNNIDISMAVAIDGGLITPIIKNADQKSIQTISREAKQLAKKAREGKLTPEEFQGGTFSISNLGMFGIDNFSAIINPPQSCILAVSRAVEKPIIEHGQIKIAHMMNVTLSSDHRVVDGAVGAEFLKALRRYIEHPILNIL
ncbi:MAG: pyruvate dehydrogenase complex dihydrolipoamide acetyltransferase [Alphaproteobacteria bacterium]|nr:pyruvate dehydrogenase complex dihydrolipoamide acetyltransferase [Alphaproteobacteria bacterium]